MRRGHPEHYIQADFFKLVDGDARTKHLPIFAVPNAGRVGGGRGIRQGAWLKAEGLRAGVPDVIVAVSHHRYSGLALEFKAPGGVVSDAQRAWDNMLSSHGWLVRTVDSVEMAWRVLLAYISGERSAWTDPLSSVAATLSASRPTGRKGRSLHNSKRSARAGPT